MSSVDVGENNSAFGDSSESREEANMASSTSSFLELQSPPSVQPITNSNQGFTLNDTQYNTEESRFNAILRAKLSPTKATMSPLKSTGSCSAGPIGLFAFGMATGLKSFVWAGIATSETFTYVALVGIIYGGFMQVFVGLFELIRGNTLIATANMNFGAFWLGISLFDILSAMGSIEPGDMPWGFFVWSMIWGVQTIMLMCCTLYTNRALQVMYFLSTTLFFVLGAGSFYPTCVTAGGYIGIALGSTAFYIAYAEILSTTYGKDILPLWPC
eukprot:CFRG6140T1